MRRCGRVGPVPEIAPPDHRAGRQDLRARLQPVLRGMAVAHALTRTAVGAGLLASPVLARSWLGPDVEEGGGRVAVRAFAVRELVVGVGLLASLRAGAPVRGWFALGTLFEAVDAAATVADRDLLPAGRVPDAIALFALSGIPGGLLVAALLEE